jgi:hypothetical protein
MFARADIACSSPMSVEDIRRGLFPNASFSSRAAVHLYAPSASPGCTKRTSGQPHFCLRIQAYARCFMQRRKPAISAWEYRHWARIIASVDLSVRLLRSWRTLTCLDRLSMRSQLRPPRRQRARGLFIFNAPARACPPRRKRRNPRKHRGALWLEGFKGEWNGQRPKPQATRSRWHAARAMTSLDNPLSLQ